MRHTDAVQLGFAVAGDTLRWVAAPGTFGAVRPGPSRPDTLVVLFAPDTVYRLDGKARRVLSPPLAFHMRRVRELVLTDPLFTAP